MPLREKIGIHGSAPLLVSIFSAEMKQLLYTFQCPKKSIQLLGRGNNRQGQSKKEGELKHVFSQNAAFEQN